MLHVVIRRIASLVTGKPTHKQSLKVVERKPDFVERRGRKGFREQIVHGIANGSRATDLHGIRDVVIVTSVLRQ